MPTFTLAPRVFKITGSGSARRRQVFLVDLLLRIAKNGRPLPLKAGADPARNHSVCSETTAQQLRLIVSSVQPMTTAGGHTIQGLARGVWLSLQEVDRQKREIHISQPYALPPVEIWDDVSFETEFGPNIGFVIGQDLLQDQNNWQVTIQAHSLKLTSLKPCQIRKISGLSTKTP